MSRNACLLAAGFAGAIALAVLFSRRDAVGPPDLGEPLRVESSPAPVLGPRPVAPAPAPVAERPAESAFVDAEDRRSPVDSGEVVFLGVARYAPGPLERAEPEASGVVGERVRERAITAARDHLRRAFASPERGPGATGGTRAEPVTLDFLEASGTEDRLDVRFSAMAFGREAILTVRVDSRTGEVDARRSFAPRHQTVRVSPEAAIETAAAAGLAGLLEASLGLDAVTRRLVWQVRTVGPLDTGDLGLTVGVLVDLETGEAIASETCGRSLSDRPGVERIVRHAPVDHGGGEKAERDR